VEVIDLDDEEEDSVPQPLTAEEQQTADKEELSACI
jgi:hypothetical protein